MAPSLVLLGTAALTVASGASAGKWSLKETIDKDNFLESFDFFNQADPTHGFVNYVSQNEALEKELFKIDGQGNVMLRPDTEATYSPDGPGRDSVRVESKGLLNKNLIIARFSHLPKLTCGLWPAFWTFGEPWPNVGEVDIIEQWNNNDYNAPAVHVGAASEFGECRIEQRGMSAEIVTTDCDANSSENGPNQGCTATDLDGPFGSASGGIYAMEWTDKSIKLFDFSYDSAPSDIDSESPDPDNWGTPYLIVKNSNCDINGHFSDHKIVLNIDFCGVAGDPGNWDECASITGQSSCAKWVGDNPYEFTESYFGIKDIRIFESLGGDHPRPGGDDTFPGRPRHHRSRGLGKSHVIAGAYAVSPTVYGGDDDCAEPATPYYLTDCSSCASGTPYTPKYSYTAEPSYAPGPENTHSPAPEPEPSPPPTAVMTSVPVPTSTSTPTTSNPSIFTGAAIKLGSSVVFAGAVVILAIAV